jgi:predicted transcriptional regulator
MLSQFSSTFARRTLASSAARSMTTVGEASTVNDALKFSGYSTIDFTISDDAPVYDAVQKFAAFNIGCLVTTDASGKLRSRVSYIVN